MQTVTIGNVEITPLQDAAVLMDPRLFLPQHADQFLEEYKDQIVDPRGLFQMSITCFLIRSAGKNVLVDTGLGPRRRPNFPVGNLDMRLKEAGLKPADIDLVIHTHLHIDHTGWNTIEGKDGKPEIYFTKAKHLIQQVEWDYWMQPRFMDNPAHPHLADTVAPLENTGRIQFVHGEQAVDENLVFVSSPGHTPGHVCVGIQSAGEKGIIVGDASHHPAQLDHPDWSPGFDADPTVSAKTRERLFEDAIKGKSRWLAGHWPYPGIGQIRRVKGRRVFRAL